MKDDFIMLPSKPKGRCPNVWYSIEILNFVVDYEEQGLSLNGNLIQNKQILNNKNQRYNLGFEKKYLHDFEIEKLIVGFEEFQKYESKLRRKIAYDIYIQICFSISKKLLPIKMIIDFMNRKLKKRNSDCFYT